MRKLSSNDRLIKPLLGTFEYQLPNENLIIELLPCISDVKLILKQMKWQLIADKGIYPERLLSFVG